MTTPPRKSEYQVVNCLRKRISFSDLGVATGLEVGWIPAGSFILRANVNIETAFNAATTNVVQVGVPGTLAGLASGTDTASGATGLKVGTGALRGNIAADTQILVSYTQTGTAATTGVADVVVEFYPFPT